MQLSILRPEWFYNLVFSRSPHLLSIVTRLYQINLEVITIDGFSGHSDRKQLMEYVRRLSPKPDKLLVCHGDAYKALDLASSIYRSYKLETKTPMNLETTRLQ